MSSTNDQDQDSNNVGEDAKRPKLSGSILVSSRQRGNPILKSIRLVPWEFSDTIIPDYIVGAKAAALYLSLRYHNLNPEYIHERLKTFTGKFVSKFKFRPHLNFPPKLNL